MSNYIINFFKKQDGSCPVEEFLDSLDNKMRAKILLAIALLETNGPQLREPYSKPLGDGIFEIRANRGIILPGLFIFSTMGSKLF